MRYLKPTAFFSVNGWRKKKRKRTYKNGQAGVFDGCLKTY